MTVERDNMIVEDYLAGRSMIEIVRENGISERRVFQILQVRGVKIERKKRQRGDPVRALSKTHAKIGRQLYDYYFERGFDRRGAANKLGVSEPTLRRMELGAHKLDLFDLQDIASFLGITVGGLLDGS